MPKWLLEGLAQIQPWDLGMVMAMDLEMEAMALVGWEDMEWEAMALVMEGWEDMALALVAWEEAWVEAWEEAMARTDAVRRSMLKVPQILT